MTTDRTLDYVPRLDERNRAHRVSTADDGRWWLAEQTTRSRYWVPGPVLDQGREGACVGFGCTAEATASPVRVRLDQSAFSADAHAAAVYRRAKEIDEWEGVDYEGTSVRAGMLVGRERGWWTGFHWAFNLTELRAALEQGPVVIGVEWREDSYEAPDGILRTTGRPVGGHCVVVTGYTRAHRKIGGPAYRIRNSWSKDWGRNGSAYIGVDGLDSILFKAGGEAAVPIGRAA